MHWYVIRTKPHQERRAECHLRQLSIETFLPLLRHKKRIRRQEQTVIEPLFPRYLFGRFDINDRYRAVKFASGVLNIVEFGLRPAEVSEGLIQAIKERLEDGYVIPKPEYFQKGQVVQIKGGPLTGLEAVFMRELTDQHRVLVLLKILGLQAKLTMDMDMIALPQALNS
jgi:transcriptional antiterminator RfaH